MNSAFEKHWLFSPLKFKGFYAFLSYSIACSSNKSGYNRPKGINMWTHPLFHYRQRIACRLFHKKFILPQKKNEIIFFFGILKVSNRLSTSEIVLFPVRNLRKRKRERGKSKNSRQHSIITKMQRCNYTGERDVNKVVNCFVLSCVHRLKKNTVHLQLQK